MTGLYLERPNVLQKESEFVKNRPTDNSERSVEKDHMRKLFRFTSIFAPIFVTNFRTGRRGLNRRSKIQAPGFSPFGKPRRPGKALHLLVYLEQTLSVKVAVKELSRKTCFQAPVLQLKPEP
jgi:hypothetical protein